MRFLLQIHMNYQIDSGIWDGLKLSPTAIELPLRPWIAGELNFRRSNWALKFQCRAILLEHLAYFVSQNA